MDEQIDIPEWGCRVVHASGRQGVTCGRAVSGRVLVMYDSALTTGAVPDLISELARATPMTDYERGYRDGLAAFDALSAGEPGKEAE